VVSEAHVIHIVDGLVYRVQCFLVVSIFLFCASFYACAAEAIVLYFHYVPMSAPLSHADMNSSSGRGRQASPLHTCNSGGIICRVTTCLENLETSGNLTVKNQGNVRKKFCHGKLA